MQEREHRMIDIYNPQEQVEIIFGAEGQLWVNVDGICKLRVKGINFPIKIEDNRAAKGD